MWWHALTDSNDGSKLGLFVLIGGVDGDGAEEDKSENCEEHERHGAEKVSALPPRRTAGGTRDHDEGRGRSMVQTCWRPGVLYRTLKRQVRGTTCSEQIGMLATEFGSYRLYSGILFLPINTGVALSYIYRGHGSGEPVLPTVLGEIIVDQ